MVIHVCDFDGMCTLAETCNLVADSSSLEDDTFRHYTKITDDECEPEHSPWKTVFDKYPIERK